MSRCFAPLRLGLGLPALRSITSTPPATRILPAAPGSKNASLARKGFSVWSTSTTPSRRSRSGSTIERRSFCASSQAVL